MKRFKTFIRWMGCMYMLGLANTWVEEEKWYNKMSDYNWWSFKMD